VTLYTRSICDQKILLTKSWRCEHSLLGDQQSPSAIHLSFILSNPLYPPLAWYPHTKAHGLYWTCGECATIIGLNCQSRFDAFPRRQTDGTWLWMLEYDGEWVRRLHSRPEVRRLHSNLSIHAYVPLSSRLSRVARVTSGLVLSGLLWHRSDTQRQYIHAYLGVYWNTHNIQQTYGKIEKIGKIGGYCKKTHHSGTRLRTTRLAVLQTCVVDSIYSTSRAFPQVELIRVCPVLVSLNPINDTYMSNSKTIVAVTLSI